MYLAPIDQRPTRLTSLSDVEPKTRAWPGFSRTAMADALHCGDSSPVATVAPEPVRWSAIPAFLRANCVTIGRWRNRGIKWSNFPIGT